MTTLDAPEILPVDAEVNAILAGLVASLAGPDDEPPEQEANDLKLDGADVLSDDEMDALLELALDDLDLSGAQEISLSEPLSGAELDILVAATNAQTKPDNLQHVDRFANMYRESRDRLKHLAKRPSVLTPKQIRIIEYRKSAGRESWNKYQREQRHAREIAKGRTIVARANLSGMSDEDRAAHKREQSKLRNAKKRAADKAANS